MTVQPCMEWIPINMYIYIRCFVDIGDFDDFYFEYFSWLTKNFRTYLMKDILGFFLIWLAMIPNFKGFWGHLQTPFGGSQMKVYDTMSCPQHYPWKGAFMTPHMEMNIFCSCGWLIIIKHWWSLKSFKIIPNSEHFIAEVWLIFFIHICWRICIVVKSGFFCCVVAIHMAIFLLMDHSKFTLDNIKPLGRDHVTAYLTVRYILGKVDLRIQSVYFNVLKNC